MGDINSVHIGKVFIQICLKLVPIVRLNKSWLFQVSLVIQKPAKFVLFLVAVPISQGPLLPQVFKQICMKTRRLLYNQRNLE
jgi:hypothetical protein